MGMAAVFVYVVKKHLNCQNQHLPPNEGLFGLKTQTDPHFPLGYTQTLAPGHKNPPLVQTPLSGMVRNVRSTHLMLKYTLLEIMHKNFD